MVQCQNIVNILNEYEMLQHQVENLEMLKISMIKVRLKVILLESFFQGETDEIVLNESTPQPVTSEEINCI